MPKKSLRLLSFLFIFFHSQAYAKLELPSDFHISPEIRKKVYFWEKIFIKHPSTSVLIYDADHAEVIIDLVDFDLLARKKNVADIPWSTRERIIDAYVSRYNLALDRFHRLKNYALKYGAIEARVWDVYSQSQETLANLYNGKTRLRSQSGLADEFIRAVHRAQPYLPYMEKIFADYNVPPVLTRLPFVESMFQISAKSKQGAVGIWQFMRTTAKQFLRVSHLVDERRSPFKATRAAAKYFRNSYDQLQAWPLTVTSYNYGTNGMIKAVGQLKSRDIDVIIGNYKSPSFQYASKNFYSEFIAAVEVYNKLLEEKRIPPEDETEIRSFMLRRPISIADLVNTGGIDEEILKKYNPCLKDIAFSQFKREKLPTPFEVFLPKEIASNAEDLLNKRYAMATQTEVFP